MRRQKPFPFAEPTPEPPVGVPSRALRTLPWLAASRGGRQRKALAPRMAPAAVRIPDPRMAQLPLLFTPIGPQIFVHEGARQALERRFENMLGGPVQLAVTDNRRNMVSQSRGRGTLKVRVHMMFLGASERVLDALCRWVIFDDPVASQLVGDFIHANSFRIRASQAVKGALKTRGHAHDLLQVLAQVNEQYFAGAISDVLITWGRRTRPSSGPKRNAIKLGTYSSAERLIRVHPALDAEWVPRYFLAYIVFHELLHHVVPPLVSGGRAELHPPEFRRRERDFRHFERALAWEQKHIDRLLRAR
jgi:hypothetical protein